MDQRGTGMTFMHAGATPQPTSLGRLIDDTIALTDLLRGYLHTSEVILVGPSWGSLLGMHVVKQRPDLFRAFVATGLVVDRQRDIQLQYDYVLSHAQANDDHQAVAALESLPQPLHRNTEGYRILRQWLEHCRTPAELQWFKDAEAMFNHSPEVTPEATKAFEAGYLNTQTSLADAMDAQKWPPALGFDFTVLFFAIEGRDDWTTPTALVTDYFRQLQAPVKGLTIVDGAGHFVMMTHPAQFLAALKGDLQRLDPR
jgi:pimeloyl-ACP methyl ester carboxylesterase